MAIYNYSMDKPLIFDCICPRCKSMKEHVFTFYQTYFPGIKLLETIKVTCMSCGRQREGVNSMNVGSEN